MSDGDSNRVMPDEEEFPEWFDRFLRGAIRERLRQEVAREFGPHIDDVIENHVSEEWLADQFVEVMDESMTERFEEEGAALFEETVADIIEAEYTDQIAVAVEEAVEKTLAASLRELQEEMVEAVLEQATDVLAARARRVLQAEAERLVAGVETEEQAAMADVESVDAEQMTLTAFETPPSPDDVAVSDEELTDVARSAVQESPHIRYVTPEGSVVAFEDVSGSIPSLGDSVTLHGQRYHITRERREFGEDGDELQFYLYEVESV